MQYCGWNFFNTSFSLSLEFSHCLYPSNTILFFESKKEKKKIRVCVKEKEEEEKRYNYVQRRELFLSSQSLLLSLMTYSESLLCL
jgi:hypothetical protein